VGRLFLRRGSEVGALAATSRGPLTGHPGSRGANGETGQHLKRCVPVFLSREAATTRTGAARGPGSGGQTIGQSLLWTWR
jgi:hypothetical protein